MWLSKPTGREVLGVILAPLFVPVLLLVSGSLTGLSLWSASFISIAFSYLGMFLFGLPLIHILKKRNSLTIAWLVAWGAFAGVVIWIIFLTLLGAMLGSESKFEFYSAILPGLIIGGMVALIYGLISGIKFLQSAT